MKTVALICPSSAGHHQTYARLFARTLLELGCAVAAFAPQPESLGRWVTAARPDLAGRLTVHDLQYARRYPVPGPLSILFDKLAWVRFVAKLVAGAHVQPDLVFHTWLDNCVSPGLTSGLTDLLFPYQWSGLYFHPWYLRRPMRYAWLRRGPLSNSDALRSHRCPAVAVLDEGVADKLGATLGGKPVIVFPDVADDSPPDPSFSVALRMKEKSRGRTIICLPGVLAKRKGMLMLMEAARQSAQEDWLFAFAGEAAPSSFSAAEWRGIQEFIGSDPDNCFFHLQRIPDEPQFNAVIQACDIVFAAYQGFFSSSNLLTKAALFEKPVVVSAGSCMGERVDRFGLGLTIAEDSVAECLAALRELAGQLRRDGAWPPARYREYRELHSQERLRSSFAALLSAAGV